MTDRQLIEEVYSHVYVVVKASTYDIPTPYRLCTRCGNVLTKLTAAMEKNDE